MEAPFLAELDAWGKTLRLRREIPSELLRYLAHNKDLSEYPLIVVAMLKKAMGCHAKFVGNDKAKIYSAHDVVALSKLTGQLGNAHRMQQQAREFLESTGLPRMQYEHIVGLLDVRIATLLTKKNEPGRQTFDNLAHIGSAFGDDLRDKFGAVAAGWHPFSKVVDTPSAAPTTDRRMREIQSTGIVTRASAASQGFIIGVEITGAEGGAFIVCEAHETHVFIKPACNKSSKVKTKLTYNALLAKYKIKPAVHEACPNFNNCGILANANFNKLS